MAIDVHHVMDHGEIQRLLRGPSGGVVRDGLRRGYAVAGDAQRRCPVDHGRLRSSIHVQIASENGELVIEVGTDVEYALWVHEGTGLYGPRAARIYPTHAKVLVFTPRKQGGRYVPRNKRGQVVVRSIAGMHGTPFLRDALPAAAH